MFRWIGDPGRGQRGQGLTEYALLIGLVALTVLVFMGVLGVSIEKKYLGSHSSASASESSSPSEASSGGGASLFTVLGGGGFLPTPTPGP